MDLKTLSNDELLVFDLLQKGGADTKKGLETKLGWTASTTNRAIQSLLSKGAIEETGLEESSGGRRPSVFDVNCREDYLVGIQIAYGYSVIVLCDLKLRVLDSEEVERQPVNTPPGLLVSLLAEAVGRLLVCRGVKKEAILGVGLCLMGPIDRESGVTGLIMDYDQPMPFWTGVPIGEMLSQALGLPVFADSSCNAGAVAEYYYGEGRGCRNISFFICDISIASAQIASGRLVRRYEGRDDGFSHMSIDVAGELCHCGKRGCAHLYTSTRAINKCIRQRIRAGSPTLIRSPLEATNFGHYIAAAKEGDKMVIESIAEAGRFFGFALSNYLYVASPDYIVIAGSNSEIVPYFYDAALEMLTRFHGRELTERVRFRRGGSFGRCTEAVGAAAMFYGRLIGDPMMD